MAESDGQEKTEQPTGKKLSDAREEGRVAKSMELNSFAVFTSGLILLYISQKFISGQFSSMSKYIFGSLDTLELSQDLIQSYMTQGAMFYFITMAPVFLGLIVIGLGISISQVGFKISTKALTPKFDKFNVLSGVKKIFFSSKSMVELLKNLLKLSLISIFVYNIIFSYIEDSPMLMNLTVPEIMEYMLDAGFSMVWKLAIPFAIIAAADFIFQRYKFNKDNMMTKQELKDEMKQTEGDPQVKSKIKGIQFSIARQRMMQDVPTADVVITNPTHFAIALRYDPIKDHAPKVVAKGVDEVAQKIKKIAVEHNIPLHEDRELARTLYKLCNIGDTIPENLFQAVAKILAYIFQLKKKTIV